MRVLIIFNHPAPYKVNAFNELAKYVDLTVLFERTKAKDRPDSFYSSNEYQFKHLFLKDGYVGKEGTISNNVRKYIKNNKNNFDIILMNGYSHLAEIKAIKYMHKHRVSFGLLINGGVIKKESRLKRKYKSSLISKASYYLSPSKASNDYLIYYGAKKENIYNYPYCNLFKKEIIISTSNKKDVIREKYQLPKDKRIFINASQFIERKNNILLMSLFKNREDHLVLVGDGPLKTKYQSYIKENNLNNVHLISYLPKDELFKLYRGVDAHISLSKEDIFGHTILEALACGLPVISSKNVVSALEYIKNDYNGYLVDVTNTKEICDAMDKVTTIKKDNILKSVMNNTFENSAKAIYEILKKVYE